MHIDEFRDWFSDRGLFISSYGLKKSIVGILCTDWRPSEDELAKAIHFIEEQAGPPKRLIVAIDADAGNRGSAFIRGVEIEIRFKHELLDSLVDFSKYIEDINFRYELAEIAEGYAFKLPDVYVPSAAFWKQGNEIKSILNVEEYVIGWACEKTRKHLAILGEYGQGKSVLALKISHRLFRSKERVPILITLGGRSPRTQNKLEILADWAATYDINPRALLVLHEAGRLLLIFDGFDEMDLVGDASLRIDHFRTLWEFSRDQYSKILITGRPNFFLDQLEREKALNVRSESIEIPYTLPLYLRPFEIDQIELALRSFSKEIRTQIIDLVRGGVAASFRDLVSRPSTLFLAANIWRELRSVENIRSAEVIGRFISHSYERQLRKNVRSFLTTLEREYFTVGIAVAAYSETRYSNHISKDAFQRAIISLLDRFPEELRSFDDITDKTRVPLKERLQDREMLIETISTDVRSCGIIVTDLSQADVFKFAHKSFFEYLYALNCVYVFFPWPLSKDKILHHAARGNVALDSPLLLYQSILLATCFSFQNELGDGSIFRRDHV